MESTAASLKICIHYDDCRIMCVMDRVDIQFEDVRTLRVELTTASGATVDPVEHTQTAADRIDAIFFTEAARARFERGGAQPATAS